MRLGGGNTMFGFTARAIEVSTGLTLWSVSVVDDGGMFSFGLIFNFMQLKGSTKL